MSVNLRMKDNYSEILVLKEVIKIEKRDNFAILICVDLTKNMKTKISLK